MTSPVTLGGLASAPIAGGSEPERLTQAAQQFEAIFLRQMLSAARSADFGGDELFGSEGEKTFREMQDSQFAQIASEKGSLGLGASIEAQLAGHLGAPIGPQA
jgi:flagellar protein FlgJ